MFTDSVQNETKILNIIQFCDEAHFSNRLLINVNKHMYVSDNYEIQRPLQAMHDRLQ
jgi:hypothetical protein